jgi:hypothetical protein
MNAQLRIATLTDEVYHEFDMEPVISSEHNNRSTKGKVNPLNSLPFSSE